jgi:hypothetical protein
MDFISLHNRDAHPPTEMERHVEAIGDPSFLSPHWQKLIQAYSRFKWLFASSRSSTRRSRGWRHGSNSETDAGRPLPSPTCGATRWRRIVSGPAGRAVTGVYWRADITSLTEPRAPFGSVATPVNHRHNTRVAFPASNADHNRWENWVHCCRLAYIHHHFRRGYEG